jgi:SAM-dependent methyltransferase
MTEEKTYLDINKESWNKRTDVHMESEFYNQEGFLKGNSSLNNIELGLLGDIKGKSILHLQCHFGQDTISLSMLGADVTGADLSDRSIEKAREVAAQMNSGASFICCDIYDLPQHLDKKFDIVFTSYGTIIWLPDLNKWAELISTYLKPGGKLVFVDFHPLVLMFDDNFEKIGYNYFNTGPIVETESGTYTDRNADIKQQYVTWNHNMGEVINALISNGLEINSLDEFDHSPYNCFNGLTEYEPKKFRIKHMEHRIPMVYAIVASKKGP